MQYRLRTLLIVLALGPPVIAGAWLIAVGQTNGTSETQVLGGIAFSALIAWVGSLAFATIRKTPPTKETIVGMFTCLLTMLLLGVILSSLFPAVR